MVDRCRMSIQSICTDVQCTNWRIESGRLWRDGCFDSKTQQRVRRNTFTFTKCVPPFSMALNNSRRKTFFFSRMSRSPLSVLHGGSVTRHARLGPTLRSLPSLPCRSQGGGQLVPYRYLMKNTSNVSGTAIFYINTSNFTAKVEENGRRMHAILRGLIHSFHH